MLIKLMRWSINTNRLITLHWSHLFSYMFFEFYGLQDATLTYFCSSKRKDINFGNAFYWTDATMLLPRSEFLYSLPKFIKFDCMLHTDNV
jgi:hypothetical protein